MEQLLVPILTFLTVVCIGSAVLVIRGARRRALEARLFGASASDPRPYGGASGSSQSPNWRWQ